MKCEIAAIGPPGNASGGREASGRWALAGLALTVLMPSLDTSIANAGLPVLAREFHAPFQAVQWIVLAYLLAITTLLVAAGRLGDILGRRRLLLGGIAVFTLASLFCGAAPGLGALVAARAVQGAGAAIMLALTLAAVRETVSQEKTGSTMGLLGTMSAIGTTLGPSLGGVLIAAFGWRTIFIIQVPLGVLNFVLAYHYLPAGRQNGDAARAHLDAPGTILLAFTLAAYSMAMTAWRGVPGAGNLALLLAAVIGGVLFLRIEARSASPLIPLEMLRDRGLSTSLAMSALVSTVLMSTLVVGPFYLSQALGFPTALVGLLLSAGPLAAALSGIPAGRLVDRLGSAPTSLAGLSGIAAACCALSFLPPTSGAAGYLVPIVCLTASYALFQAANNTAVMASAGTEQRGVISGLLSVSRNLGLITGTAAMGAIFAFRPEGHGAETLADAVAASTRHTFSAAAVLMAVAMALALHRRTTRIVPIGLLLAERER